MKSRWKCMEFWRRSIGLLLVLAMTLTSTPALAFGSAGSVAKEGESGQDAGVIEEEACPDAEYESADVEMAEEDDSILDKSIGDYTDRDKYLEEIDVHYVDGEFVSNEQAYAGNEYTITYMKEDAVLVDNAQETIAALSNNNISLGNDGVVTQMFIKDAEDALAPLVYQKSGMKVKKGEEWKLTYSVYHPGSGSDDSGYTTKETKYFSSDAKVKDLQNYSKNGQIELYPNWEARGKVKFDTDSLKGVSNPNPGPEFYDDGDQIELKPIEERSQDNFVFEKWTYKFGYGAEQDAVPVKSKPGYFNIDTTGHKEDLTIYAKWIDANKTTVTFDEASLRGVENPNAGITEYTPGKELQLSFPKSAPEDSTFLGWRYHFENEETVPARLLEGSEDVSVIPTTGKGTPLFIEAVWLDGSTEIQVVAWSNQADLHKKSPSSNVLDDVGDPVQEDLKISFIPNPKYTMKRPKEFKEYKCDSEELEQIGWAFSAEPENNKPDCCYLFELSEKPWRTVIKEAFGKGGLDADNKLQLYAIWDYASFRISYDGLIGDAIGNNSAFPKVYNSGETLILPTAEEINKGELLPEFSEKYIFEGWTNSEKGTQEIKTLGKDGDYNGAAVTLYAKYKVRTGDEDEDLPIDRHDYFAYNIGHNNKYNILYPDEPLLIYISPRRNGLRADPRYIKLLEDKSTDDVYNDWKDKEWPDNKYWEICPIDTSNIPVEKCETVFGIKLKKEVITKYSAEEIESLGEKVAKIAFRIRGIDDSTGKLDDKYYYVWMRVYMGCDKPGYKLDKRYLSIGKLPEQEETVNIRLRETTGKMTMDKGDGEWEIDYVKKNETEPLPPDCISGSVETDKSKTQEIVLKANLEKLKDPGDNEVYVNGDIRLRNTRWYPGEYVLFDFSIRQYPTRTSKLTLDKTSIFMNNRLSNEVEEVKLYFDGVGEVSMNHVSVKDLPKGITWEKNNERHSIIFKGAKDVKVQKKKVTIRSMDPRNPLGERKASLEIVVCNNSATSGAKFKIAGGAIYALGDDSQLFIEPTINGYAGEITSAAIKKNYKYKNGDGAFLYKVYWDGKYVVVKKHPTSFVFQKGGYTETIRLTLSTGTYVYGKIKIVPEAGSLTLNFPSEQTLYAKADPSASVPVTCRYVYRYYMYPHDNDIKQRTIEINKDTILYQTGTSKPNKVPVVQFEKEVTNPKVDGTYDEKTSRINLRVKKGADLYNSQNVVMKITEKVWNNSKKEYPEVRLNCDVFNLP